MVPFQWGCYKLRKNPHFIHASFHTNAAEQVVDKLFLTRQQLNRCKRVLQLSYQSNLEELGLLEHGKPKEAVLVTLMVQKCGDGDYLVKSRVNTRLQCECDRCLNKFELAVEGYFQLLLASKPHVQELDTHGEEVSSMASSTVGFEDLEVEVWEPFTCDIEQVSLYSHVYDSIMLSLPSKILCDEGCPGIPIEEYQKNVETTLPQGESKVETSGENNDENRPVGWEDIHQLQVYFQNRKKEK